MPVTGQGPYMGHSDARNGQGTDVIRHLEQYALGAVPVMRKERTD